MRAIGGYFEMELADGGNVLHQATTFKTGRAALKFLLQLLQPQKVFIPFYTCDALLQPFEESGVSFEYYAINLYLDPVQLPDLLDGEMFLFINYFDLKRSTVLALSEKYGSQLIVDCSQAFFMQANGKSWYFNSCRKFFGVPDGAYLMPPINIEVPIVSDRNENYTITHLIKRLEGKVEEGFDYYKENETRSDSDIKNMSVIAERLLSQINYEQIKQKRVQNFEMLHDLLGNFNQFELELTDDAVPMVYPLLLKKKADHAQLWNEKIYVPIYWNDVLKRKTNIFNTEIQLTENMLPLPIDQRYSEEDMKYIAKTIKKQC